MTNSHSPCSAGSCELKPCPFCGGSMVEVTDEDGHYFVHPGRNGLERADCWLADAWVSDETSGEGSIGEWNMRAGPTEPLQCLRCGTVDAFGPLSKERQTNINECPSCKRMFKDGETCSRGGCPMGGDL